MFDEEPAGQPLFAEGSIFPCLEDEVVPYLVDVLLDRQEEPAEPVLVSGDEIEVSQAFRQLAFHEVAAVFR